MNRITKWLACTLMAALLAALLGACGGGTASSAPAASTPGSEAQSTPETPPPGISPSEYPRVDGSTANLPLMAAVLREMCGFTQDAAEGMASASGTYYSWRALLEGEADLLLVYEAPDAIRERYGSRMESELEIVPIGRDALVFLVNDANPVTSLTQEQLRSIYTGRATSWAEVGGDDGAIIPYQRNQTSGSQTLFLKLLMEGAEPMEPPTDQIVSEMGPLIETISVFDSEDAHAIGFSVFFYASEMYASPNVKLLAVDSVTPTNESIESGEYPLVNDFYLVIRRDAPADSAQRMIFDWLQTGAGEQVLRGAGYIPAPRS